MASLEQKLRAEIFDDELNSPELNLDDLNDLVEGFESGPDVDEAELEQSMKQLESS